MQRDAVRPVEHTYGDVVGDECKRMFSVVRRDRVPVGVEADEVLLISVDGLDDWCRAEDRPASFGLSAGDSPASRAGSISKAEAVRRAQRRGPEDAHQHPRSSARSCWSQLAM